MSAFEELKARDKISAKAFDSYKGECWAEGVRWLAAHSGQVIENLEDPSGFVARPIEADRELYRKRSERHLRHLQALVWFVQRQIDDDNVFLEPAGGHKAGDVVLPRVEYEKLLADWDREIQAEES